MGVSDSGSLFERPHSDVSSSLAHQSLTTVYWTAFIGLFFDCYDLYLFSYLDRVLAKDFQLDAHQSSFVQAIGLVGVGLGALLFGYLADRFGRGKVLLAVFGIYAVGLIGLSLAQTVVSLLAFRLLSSMALGAEWGISHTYLAEHAQARQRYRLSAFLQFSLLGGLLAALATRFLLPITGWRWLFAGSIIPIALLAAVRWTALRDDASIPAHFSPRGSALRETAKAITNQLGPFVLGLALASLSIASGTINVFFAKELPQSVWATVLFWVNVVPGMLLGAWVVQKFAVKTALVLYGVALVLLSVVTWFVPGSGRSLAFALLLPILNGIPFGLMGAWFNELFGAYRTMLSGAAYNLGRILAGFSPLLVTSLGLNQGGNYFLFTTALGVCVIALASLGGTTGVNRPR